MSMPRRPDFSAADAVLASTIHYEGEKLVILVRHLDRLLKLGGARVDHDAHHWIRMTQKELRSTVFMDGISLVHVKRIVARGRQTGLIETFNPRNHQPLLYRLDYTVNTMALRDR